MSATSRYSTWRDYYLVIQGFFYGSQGVAYGIALFLAAYLRSFGISESRALTLQSLLLIPWYVKFLFGLFSDNVQISTYGRRKPYVLFAAIIGLGGWITLPLYSEYSVLILMSGVAASLGIALADASIDALAVDITPPHRRGSMQGVSWGFRAIGFGSATLFAGPLVDNGEWLYLFLIPGILSTVSSFLVLLFKEQPLPEDFSRLPGSVYREVFSSKAIGLTVIFQILSGAAIAIIFLLESFLNAEFGYSASDIGLILFSFGIGMFAGAIILGMLGDRFEFSSLFTVLSMIYIIIIASIFLFDLGKFNQAVVYFMLIGFINGGYEASQMRMGMDYSPEILSGTMFNLYNSLSNIGQIAIGPILVFAIIQEVPTKLGWQILSLFLLLALVIALKLRNDFSTEQIAVLGLDSVVENNL